MGKDKNPVGRWESGRPSPWPKLSATSPSSPLSSSLPHLSSVSSIDPSKINYRLPSHLPPVAAGTLSFYITMALSTFSQGKILHISTGSVRPLPTLIGAASVAVGGLVAHGTSVAVTSASFCTEADRGWGPLRLGSRAGSQLSTPMAAKRSRSDAEYLVEIRAHKCILTARGEYFKALFRKGSSSSSAPAKGGGSASSSSSSLVVAFRESTENTIKVDEEFGPRIVRLMLEFVYTNKIRGIRRAHLEDLLGLLHLSDRWLLRDLKRLVEHEIINHHIDINSVPRIYCATEDYHARRLSKACIDYIMENIREVAGNASFQDHLSSYPELCIPILRAAAEMMPEPTPKRSRTAADHHPSTPGTVRDEEG